MAGCEGTFILMFGGTGAVALVAGLFVFNLRPVLGDQAHRMSKRSGIIGFLNGAARSAPAARGIFAFFGVVLILMGLGLVAGAIWVAVSGAEVECTDAEAVVGSMWSAR